MEISTSLVPCHSSVNFMLDVDRPHLFPIPRYRCGLGKIWRKIVRTVLQECTSRPRRCVGCGVITWLFSSIWTHNRMYYGNHHLTTIVSYCHTISHGCNNTQQTLQRRNFCDVSLIQKTPCHQIAILLYCHITLLSYMRKSQFSKPTSDNHPLL